VSTPPPLPSGTQVELVFGDQRATVVEIGGGLRRYEVDGEPVLDGYDETAMAANGRGQLLVPWPNRIDGGRWTLDGQTYQLALSEAGAGNAIHGLTRWSAWDLDQSDDASVTASFLLRPQPGYPFVLRCRATYRLDAGGLTTELSVTNVDSRPAPVGIGVHPYLLVTADGAGLVDAAELTVPAATWLPTDERGIPTGSEPVDGGPYDFRAPHAIGELKLDTAYTDLDRDADGRVWVDLGTPDGRLIRVWADSAWPYLQVFTGDTLPPAQRRHSIAVEPMTCPPNAFNTGIDLLEPGATLTGAWGLRLERRWVVR
jgi:aldose 1-epimerase